MVNKKTKLSNKLKRRAHGFYSRARIIYSVLENWNSILSDMHSSGKVEVANEYEDSLDYFLIRKYCNDQCPAFSFLGINIDRESKGRRLKKGKFEEALLAAIDNLARELKVLGEDSSYIEERETYLTILKKMQEEHFATPYNNTLLSLRVSYQSRQITSDQLQDYLCEMEKRNPSKRFGGGKK